MGNSLNYIHPEAKIGKNVVIEPFAFIDKNVEIADNTWIGPNAVINSGARIGKGCKIFSGATIAAIPQDLKFAGEETLTEIGDNTIIREYVNISRGTDDKKTTKIGSNCLIMAFVHIAHDCMIGDNCIIVNSVQLGGHVTIDDWAIIGGASAIHQFVKVGRHVMISGGSLVRKDVPPYVKAAREPLTYCGINSVGLRRRGFSNERINDIQEIYRNLYLSGLNNAKALEKIETLIPSSEERDNITSFVRQSERGIMKGYSN
ncbi:acyl-ACP--UDP-N-acetylglucosamine O-acyltransferase [Marivirga sp. S37H4]|uniref:Acyl-ACP--UDP-N-acetylglucosamine O-acyltransferase n=1 Tax=Marivirga aurantiaca TaxID=2802615 RepID=A0A934WVT2_9BACT|nr:acyl-ACP--UDP-N-acetylglucosamine O-acyltransferase [Marivirga aurantiaca]MBK6263882.1 acyl-ACP--UDP-N-acetylglucosamine O-acyltransferase [Marivirga aurantiaca]